MSSHATGSWVPLRSLSDTAHEPSTGCQVAECAGRAKRRALWITEAQLRTSAVRPSYEPGHSPDPTAAFLHAEASTCWRATCRPIGRPTAAPAACPRSADVLGRSDAASRAARGTTNPLGKSAFPGRLIVPTARTMNTTRRHVPVPVQPTLATGPAFPPNAASVSSKSTISRICVRNQRSIRVS